MIKTLKPMRLIVTFDGLAADPTQARITDEATGVIVDTFVTPADWWDDSGFPDDAAIVRAVRRQCPITKGAHLELRSPN